MEGMQHPRERILRIAQAQYPHAGQGKEQNKMKAVEIVKPYQLRIVDRELPLLDAQNNVLIRLSASGICGSDVGIYHGTNAAATYPRVIGHEIVGVVERTAPGVTRVQPGQRVIVDQVVPCGQCYACRMGRPNVCGSLRVRGVNMDGGYREYIAVPAASCYLVPQGLSDAEAVMIEPATIAVQGCTRAQLSRDDTLLLYGYGALGSSIMRIARLSGARILVADIDDAKLAEAKHSGAHETINPAREDLEQRCKELTGGYGPTVTIDAACVKESLLNALQVTGCAGRVITMGFSTQPVEVNQYLITSKELDVRGSRLQNRRFQAVIDLINQGKLDLRGTVSHTFPFTQAQKAFDLIDSRDPSVRKVVLTFPA